MAADEPEAQRTDVRPDTPTAALPASPRAAGGRGAGPSAEAGRGAAVAAARADTVLESASSFGAVGPTDATGFAAETVLDPVSSGASSTPYSAVAAAVPFTPAAGPERYVVGDEIGRGGMGRIVRVLDTALNRDIAMKLLLGGGSPEHLRRFVEEARITSQLDHPSVLPVHDVGCDPQGNVFFTMKLIAAGDTVQHVIERLRAGDEATHRRYTFERRVQVVQQVCNALQYAHERGVVHRDIKPANIILGAHGEVYLLDWGVAKLLDRPAAPASAAAPDGASCPLTGLPTGRAARAGTGGDGVAAPAPPDRPIAESTPGPADDPAPGSAGDPAPGSADDEAQATAFVQGSRSPTGPATQDGELLGTIVYMAPEQVRGAQDEIDARTDVYALTAVLYELLSLEHYLAPLAPRMSEVVTAVLKQAPIDAEDRRHPINGRAPRALSRICRRGLLKAREQRFQSAQELAAALQIWLEGNAPIVCPGTAIQRSLARLSAAIDARPVLVPAVTITAALLLLGWLVAATALVLAG